MTFSICVRETDEDANGDEQTRFGVAVTTRLAGVGTLCPFANEHGAVATQSLVNVELGRKGIEYLADGLAVDDALQSLLNADEGAPNRQLHGVGHDGTFAFSGEECKPWFGHIERENFTVAGNLLTGESVIEATAAAYVASAPRSGAETSSGEGKRAATEGSGSDGRAGRESEPRPKEAARTAERGVERPARRATREASDPRDGDPDVPLAERLIDALAAGHAEGGDKREDMHVQSAALLVTTTEDREMVPYYNDLRVDATETPIEDLRETYAYATEGFEMAVERYADAYEADDMEDVEG
jgi:uncharacterized Ntn-hydrolase superfamily protein